MLRSISYILNPLLLLVSWSVFFSWQQYLWFWVVFGALLILLTAFTLSSWSFWRYKMQWFNFVIIYLSQFSFLLLLKNNVARYFLAVIITLLWSFTWWMLKQHFKNLPTLRREDYLVFKKYWYTLNLWFFSSSVYALVVFLSLDFYFLLLPVVVFIYCLLVDLLAPAKKLGFLVWMTIIFLSAQLFMVVYFLPVSFYIAGTILVLWFYFLTRLLDDDKKSIKWIFITLMVITLFLLISSLYIIL